MAINNYPGVGPQNTDVATAVAAAVPNTTQIAAAVPTIAQINSSVTANAKALRVQEFTATGTFTVPTNCNAVEILLVAGGGGGGGAYTGAAASIGCGGGGGAGGVVQKTLPVTAGGSYTVTIGGAGAGGTYLAIGGNGGDSSFGALATATGGGAGATHYTPAPSAFGANGGCGGGCSYAYSSTGAWGVAGWGGSAGGPIYYSNAGYSTVTATWNTPSSVGTRAKGSQGYPGGWGTNSTSNSAYAIDYAPGIGVQGYGIGGPGGCFYTNTYPPTSYYGSTAQAQYISAAVAGNAATANTGNGGGGAIGNNVTQSGGNGGSGYCRVIYWS